jgi:4-alpha-glucanotransferase
VVTAKLAVLRALFAQFNAHDSDTLHKEFARFVKRGGRALEDHARFEALQAAQLQEANEGHWRNWARVRYAIRAARPLKNSPTRIKTRSIFSSSRNGSRPRACRMHSTSHATRAWRLA